MLVLFRMIRENPTVRKSQRQKECDLKGVDNQAPQAQKIANSSGPAANRTVVNGNAGSCIQGSAIGNATSASSSACSWRIPGMFSFRSTRDDRTTQFLLHSRPQWSTCGLGITLRVPEQRCVQTSTAPCTERPRISHQAPTSTRDSGSRRIPPRSGHM